jgi:hypothetical protein
VAAATVVATIASSVALAVPALPAPGSATQVAQLVVQSTSITTLDATLATKLAQAANDNPATDYPQTAHECLKLTSCVFGTKTSRRDLVVMGDSHAQMWIPALSRIGRADHAKVIVLFLPQCPAATLSVWLNAYATAYTQCTNVRRGWIAAIVKLHPATVVLTDHTAGIFTAASTGTQPFTAPQWEAGMKATISALRPSRAKLAILGDPVTFGFSPLACLASNPGDVQACAVPDPNPKAPGQQLAEAAAAKADAVRYVDPTKWLCTTTCSPVIGEFFAYYDTFHLSCTYAAFLSGVLYTALKPVLPKP